MKKLFLALLVGIFLCPSMIAQGITSHQYRRIDPANMQEYLKRETTYWSKLAEQEVKKGNLTFWAILQRVGGEDIQNAPNILIINSFNNMDTANEIWGGIEELFPDVKMEDMATWNLGKSVTTVYLRSLGNHTEPENTNMEEDFKYVHIIYHDTNDAGKHLDFEAEKWKPMIKKAMDEGKTTMKGWGNAVVISPESPDFPYKTQSYDLFSSMTDALGPGFSEDFTWPEDFAFPEDNYKGPRHSHLYRIVQAVTAPPPAE